MRSGIFQELVIVALGVLFFGQVARGKLPPEMMPDEAVVYKASDGVKLKLQIFEPANHKASDKTPCIVFFHGGGWAGGGAEQFYPQSRYLASRGMVAISAQYRLVKRGRAPDVCVEDAKSAIRWVRRHAKELGIDPGRIAAGGGSAGGHLAAATANLKGFDAPGGDKSISCRPNALVLFNPVFDNGPGGYGYALVKDRWREFSPMQSISKESPPAVVFLGTKDQLIPMATGQKYRDLMRAAGVRCDLHFYDGQRHGFFNYRDGKNPYYVETLREADKFLRSLGYLKGEPTVKAE